jgi:predicted enzyme related to lactoylglutathione lyase
MADSARGRIVWYELMTTDMKAAQQFYGAIVGWTVTPFDGAPDPYAMFMRNGQMPTAGVMAIPAGMNFPPHWGMYVAVDKLEDAVVQIEKLGGAALSPVIEVPNIGRMRTMLDPQKAAFSVYESATEHLPDAPREVGDASWHELMTTDASAALKFYGQIFGWQESTVMDMGPMGKYHIFKGCSYGDGAGASALGHLLPGARRRRVRRTGRASWRQDPQRPNGSAGRQPHCELPGSAGRAFLASCDEAVSWRGCRAPTFSTSSSAFSSTSRRRCLRLRMRRRTIPAPARTS